MRSFTTLVCLGILAGCTGDDDKLDTASSTDVGEGVSCEGNVCVLSGVITEDLTLTSDIDWLLRGGVFIGDDDYPTTLTIEPGTTLYGETSTDGMLVIRRNATIDAQGTADAPIIMTSSKSAGSRARGDWGGLIINGNAPINSCGADYEGDFCEAYGEGGTGWYGGTDASDNSGTLKYVRVEFAGTLISPDNELNGIAFQGVGSGTKVDYIQVHMNADDGVEFFGGTAEVSHVLVTGVGDDLFDWTDGWQGSASYVVLQQYDDAGDQGIEADNNGDDNEASPRSYPTLSNFTIVGSPDSESSDIGVLLREGTAVSMDNVIVAGFNEGCLDVDHDVTWTQADGGDLSMSNVLLDCSSSFVEDEDEPSVADYFATGNGNTEGNSGLADPFNLGAPDFSASGNITGAVASGDDWLAGWTTHELN